MRAGVVALGITLVSIAHAGTGDLDPTFGTGGLVEGTFFGTPDGMAVGTILVQPDGKVIAVGALDGPVNGDGFALARYESDGTLDPTFGMAGVTSLSLGDMGFTPSAVLQPDGRIVAANHTANFFPPTIDSYIVRFDSTGNLDPTFASGGILILDGLVVADLALQADGSIVASGGNGEYPYVGRVMRRLPDGSLDPSFGSGGFADVPAATGVAIQADGRIVTVGGDTLVRLDVDGTLDPSFGVSGIVAPACAGSCNLRQLTLQSDGKIVAAGGIDSDAFLARFDTDGTPDSSFGIAGAVRADIDVHVDGAVVGNSDFITDLLVDPDGRIVVAGSSGTYYGYDLDYFVARFDADGSLDGTFGAGGWSLVDFGTRDDAFALARQDDGGLLLGGWADVYTAGGHFGIARLDGACPLAPDSDSDGRGDACDPCTDPAPIEVARLRLTRLLEPPGLQKLKVKGFLAVPGVPTVDPLSRGLRVLITTASGDPLIDLPVLGTRDDVLSQAVWTVNTTGTTFTFKPNSALVEVRGAVVRARVISLGGGLYKVTVTGKDGAFSVTPDQLPLSLTVVLDARRSEVGQCGEIGYLGPVPAPVCAFSNTGSALSCR